MEHSSHVHTDLDMLTAWFIDRKDHPRNNVKKGITLVTLSVIEPVKRLTTLEREEINLNNFVRR